MSKGWLVVWIGFTGTFAAVSPARANLNAGIEALTMGSALGSEVRDRIEVVTGTTSDCVYDMESGRITVSETIAASETEVVARCLAPAVAQMKYESIEDQWLEHSGVRQAWVLDRGSVRTKELSNKVVTEPTARATWVVLASREMLLQGTKEKKGDPSRGIASIPIAKSDSKIRELLGLVN